MLVSMSDKELFKHVQTVSIPRFGLLHIGKKQEQYI